MASIKKRPDGRWRARYRDPSGREHARHFDRRVDAERFLTGIEHSKLAGAYIDPTRARTTVADYYRVWADRQPWRPSSRASIESMFRGHVLPAFGDRPLGTIRRGDVEAWAAGLPLSGRTAGLAVQYLATMLEGAVADGLLAVNPARGVKRPRVEAEPVVPFTADQLDALYDAAPDWFRVVITLGAAAGLRQSEATGLTLDRVDFLGRSLVVDRQLVTPAIGEPAFGPPKTSRSFRTVPLADVAVEGLSAHVEHHGTGTHGLVLHEEGRPVRRQRFGKVWRALRHRADLPVAQFHTLRHTYASTLLSGGVSVAAAADYLGHSPAVLLRTYAHLLPADHDRARAVVQAAFATAPVTGQAGSGRGLFAD
ncbi:MAG: tyrosine-type recombinase/integrase [Acidimicrobiia bacterium]